MVFEQFTSQLNVKSLTDIFMVKTFVSAWRKYFYLCGLVLFHIVMTGRSYFAWRLAEQIEEDARLEASRQEMIERRRAYNPLSSLSDTQFIKRYRISKEAYEFLVHLLRCYTNLRSSQRVSLENKIASALLFYAHGDYQKVVGMANNLSQMAISRYIDEVTDALNHPNILATFIKFPQEREARAQIQAKFYNKYGIPGVIGCVDGSHFRIFKPKTDVEHLYYCRKHYHSLNVQMVCDSDCKILAINPKFGGASHDAFVWENSTIRNMLETIHRNGEPVVLLGDSGYPQRPWLMTPYSEPTPGSSEETYNYCHSRARVVIENTFGLLKNRWRCVCKDRVLHYKPKKCAKIIIACSVLHNLAIQFRVTAPPLDDAQIIEPLDVPDLVQGPPDNRETSMLLLGRLARDRIARRLHAQRNIN